MTDLDDTVARHLHDQPPVNAPPLDVIRRRAARRRNRLAGQWALAAVTCALAVAVVVPSLDGDREPDTIAAPVADGPIVAPGAVRGEACPASPYNGGPRGCGYASDPAVVRSLADLVNTERPPAVQTGCRPADRGTPNVRMRFVAADGTATAARVVGCLLTVDDDPDRRPVYAPDVARAASQWLTDWGLPADGSDKEGCEAVIEDLAALTARITADGLLRPQATIYAEVAEVTIAEERPYLTGEQQAVADRVRPQLNSLIVGGYPDPSAPARVIHDGLETLQDSCR